jgi:hypothetical protein
LFSFGVIHDIQETMHVKYSVSPAVQPIDFSLNRLNGSPDGHQCVFNARIIDQQNQLYLILKF